MPNGTEELTGEQYEAFLQDIGIGPSAATDDVPIAQPTPPTVAPPPIPLPMRVPQRFIATSAPPAFDPMEQMRGQINAAQFKTQQEALDAAERFQAMRAYHRDLEAGKDPNRWLPLIFKKNPTVIPGMMREQRLAAPPQVFQGSNLPPGIVYGGRVTFPPGQTTAAQKDIAEASRLRQSAEALRASGDIEGSKRAEYEKALFESKFLGPKETIEVTPEGVRIQKGGKTEGEGPTTGFKTRLQEQMHNYDSAMNLLEHINRNMGESDFGIRGVAKELWSRIGGQVGAQVKPEEMDVRKSVGLLRTALYKSLRSDSNITEAERKQIESLLPSTGALESLPNALSSLNAVRRQLQFATRRSAKELGIKPPDWAQSYEERVRAAFKSKKLTENQAVQAIERFRTLGSESPLP